MDSRLEDVLQGLVSKRHDEKLNSVEFGDRLF